MAEQNIKASIGTPSITEVDYSSERDSIRLGIIIPIIEDNSTIGGINGTVVLNDIERRLGASFKCRILNDLFSTLKNRKNTNEKYGFFIFDRIIINPSDCDHRRRRFKEVQRLIPKLLSQEFHIQISFMINKGTLE